MAYPRVQCITNPLPYVFDIALRLGLDVLTLGWMTPLALIPALICCLGLNAYPADLVTNGLLSNGAAALPAAWQHEAFDPRPDAAKFEWISEVSGPGVLKISNSVPNDSRWFQTIAVSPSRWYRVSAWVRAENVGTTGGLGAYLADLDDDYYSPDLRGTQGWQEVEFWMKTGPSQHSVRLACRLGGYSALNTGDAYFAGVSFVQMGSPPSAAKPIYGAGFWDSHGFSDFSGHFSIPTRLIGLILPIVIALLLVRFIASAAGQDRLTDGKSRKTTGLTPEKVDMFMPKIAPVPDGAPLALFSLGLAAVGLDALILLRWSSTPTWLTITSGCLAGAGLVLSIFRLRMHEQRPSRFPLSLSSEQVSFLGVFVLFLAFYSVTRGGPTPFVSHVHQAYAFLQGHLWVVSPGYFEEVQSHGHSYLLDPPLSPIILLPFVAIWGLATDQQAASIVIGAIEIALAWRLLGLLGLTPSVRLWLTAFFGAGTILWYEATWGASWGFALVLSVAPTLLALNELFGKARPWVVAIFAGLAALARYDLVSAWPIYALALLVRGRGWRELLWMAPGFIFAGAVYVGFNESRYGTLTDIGLWLWYQYDGAGLKSHPDIPGPFSLHFLPANLYTVFFMGPSLNDQFPYIHPTGGGQALTLTSPAFILALRPSIRRPIVALLWFALLLGSAASLSVYANGFVQFGTRYWIQVFPFLLVLVALGTGKRADQLTKVLIIASILIIALSIWHIRTIGFG